MEAHGSAQFVTATAAERAGHWPPPFCDLTTKSEQNVDGGGNKKRARRRLKYEPGVVCGGQWAGGAVGCEKSVRNEKLYSNK